MASPTFRYKYLTKDSHAELDKYIGPHLTRSKRARLYRDLEHDVSMGRKLLAAASAGPSVAEHRGDLRGLIAAVEKASDHTLRAITRGMARRLTLPSIPHTAIRDAITEELERPLRGLVIEPGHGGPGIEGTAERRKNGEEVPVRLVAKKLRERHPGGRGTDGARRSFVVRVVASLRFSGLDVPKMKREDLVETLRICLLAAGFAPPAVRDSDGKVTRAMRALVNHGITATGSRTPV